MLARRLTALACIVASLSVCALLLRFPPTQYNFYPKCPIHTYLHILCPGCGATRALAALLHGHLNEAMHWNALFVVLLPFLLAYIVVCCYRAMRAETFHWPQLPNRVITGLLVAVAAFTAARNLWA